MIEIKGLKKYYDEHLVLDIGDFSVEKGEILAVLGPSGAGKSVLLRLMSLLERPSAGSVVFRGARVSHLKGRERLRVSRHMVMLFQDPYLFRGSVSYNVGYGLRVRGMNSRICANRISKSLEDVGLTALSDRDVRTLSGGEAQRVALARALVIEPEVMFLDEPFASLDRLNRSDLQSEVKRILKGLGITAVFVTHDQEEAARVGDRIAVLQEGRIVQTGRPKEVFYRPATESAARFVGMENLYDGVVTSKQDGLVQVGVAGGVLELVSDRAIGEAVTVGLRPEDITLVPPGDLASQASSRNAVTGEVTGIELMGPTARVTVVCPFPVVAAITRRSLDDLGISVGQKIGVRFKATALHVI